MGMYSIEGLQSVIQVHFEGWRLAGQVGQMLSTALFHFQMVVIFLFRTQAITQHSHA
jgi:hypothetical protein